MSLSINKERKNAIYCDEFYFPLENKIFVSIFPTFVGVKFKLGSISTFASLKETMSFFPRLSSIIAGSLSMK